MRKTLICGAAAALLLTTAACDPASIGLAAAGMALDAISGGGTETAAGQAPNIMDSLSGLDTEVSESCLAKIDQMEAKEDAEPRDVAVETRGGNAESTNAVLVEAEADETATVDAASDQPALRTADTQTNLSSETQKVCSLQPVCLPGNSFPVEMMMCTEEAVVASASSDSAPAADPDIDTTPKEVTWMWGAEETVEEPAP